MIDFIKKMWEMLSKPEVIAVVVAVPVLLTAVGAFFKKIGEIIPGDDWAEGLSAKISKFVTALGKIFSWLGIGNAKK